MKKLIASVLFACVRVGPVSAQTRLNDPTDLATVKQIETEMGDAMVAVDIVKLNHIFADDWAPVGSSGKIYTKESLLGDFKSGKDKLEWFKNGPMDAQVFGNVAVVHGSVTEKRTSDGKDTSGQFLWMGKAHRSGIVRNLWQNSSHDQGFRLGL